MFLRSLHRRRKRTAFPERLQVQTRVRCIVTMGCNVYKRFAQVNLPVAEILGAFSLLIRLFPVAIAFCRLVVEFTKVRSKTETRHTPLRRRLGRMEQGPWPAILHRLRPNGVCLFFRHLVTHHTRSRTWTAVSNLKCNWNAEHRRRTLHVEF